MERSGNSYPGQFDFISRNLSTVRLQKSCGFHDTWDVPFAVWQAPAGMDAAYPASEHVTVTCLKKRSVLSRIDRPGKGLRGGAAPDEVIMYGGGYDRHYVAREDASCIQVYMTQDLIATFGQEVFRVDRIELRPDRLFIRDGTLRRAVEAYVQRGLDAPLPPTRLEMNARATLLGLHLVTHYSTRSTPRGLKDRALGAQKLQRVLERIDANLDGNLRVSDLSDEVDLGVRQFYAGFLASMGTTPHAYLLERRILRAKTLLRGRQSLATIALDCGFASQQHFSTAFRKSVGLSPGAWRKAQSGPSLALSQDEGRAASGRMDH